MFTKRHYEALAEIIRTFRVDNGASYDAATQEVSDFVRSPLAYTFAMALRRDNPAFDLEWFIKACEPPKPIEPWHGQGPRPAVPPPPMPGFEVDEIGHMEGSRVVITGKSFRLLNVGQAFRFLSERGVLADDGKTKLPWQGAQGPWVKVGARSYRRLENGHAHGPTFTVGTINVLTTLEP